MQSEEKNRALLLHVLNYTEIKMNYQTENKT